MKIRIGLYFLIFISLFSCSSHRARNSKDMIDFLVDKEWTLVSVRNDIQNDFIAPGSNRRVTLKMDKDNNYFGFDGCNNFRGNYTVSKSSIRFNQGISTLKACLESDPVDPVFYKALEQINNFSIDNNQLVLKKDSEIFMIYKL